MTAPSPLPTITPSTSEDLAFAAWEAGDLRAAFLHFRTAVAEGERGALHDLAYFHDEGMGTPRSKHDAIRWYKKAGRNDSGSAFSNIAILHRERCNLRATFRWFQRSARAGDGDSLVELAVHHRDGLGTPRWPSRAIANARRAVRSSHISEGGRDDAREILRELWFAQSSARITGLRDRRRALSVIRSVGP